ncbi:MAG: hypothetical protein KGH66_02085 [Candidatus Micrarchaeota archaeon]|nr:hypothetical protein [Candidatus Micrarchaeota archaeon]
MSEKSIKSLDETEKKLKSRAKNLDQLRLNSAGKFAVEVAENIYAQFATGMSRTEAKAKAAERAESIITSFSQLDKSMTAVNQTLKVNMKGAAYMAFLNYLRDKDTEAAGMLYNNIMTGLKARDHAVYAGLIKGGYPAMLV